MVISQIRQEMAISRASDGSIASLTPCSVPVALVDPGLHDRNFTSGARSPKIRSSTKCIGKQTTTGSSSITAAT